jgi:hypothetical protein
VDLASHISQLSQVLISDAPHAQPSAAAPAKRSKPVHGTVHRIRQDNNTVEMAFSHGWKPAVGSWVLVYHEYLLERACLGALEVVSTSGNHVLARASGDIDLTDLTKGDEVVSR